MRGKEFNNHKNGILTMLIRYQMEHDLDDEWLLRMLLELTQHYVVRFEE